MMIPGMTSPAAAVARHVFKSDPFAWWTRYGSIVTKAGAEICPPTANFLQQEVTRAIRLQSEQGRPVRIIILKPRQKGSSTYSTACLYHWCRRRPTRGTIIGGQYSQVQNLWSITRRYATHDKFDWGNEVDVGSERLEFTNGSVLDRETARDEDAGRSGTIQALVVTELGRWKEGLTISASKVLAGILSCVPANEPDTLVILESTANGMQGPFYERWQGAATVDQAKRGEWCSGYIRVFAPWFAFSDAVVRMTEKEKRDYAGTVTAKEEELIQRHSVTFEQLAWRRLVIASELSGDEALFDQEYPSDDVSAFLSSGRLMFPANNIEVQRKQVEMQLKPTHGVLDEAVAAGSVVLRPTPALDAFVTVWEEPIPGRKYVLSVDPATGSQHQASDDPDRHAAMVIRAGYRLADGWHPPRVVARIKPPCFVALDVLAEWVRRLSWYYGGCLVVPESNNSGMALIELLKPMGVAIYERQTWNQRENRKIKLLGWQTTEATRIFALQKLARALREYGNEQEGVEVPCPHILDELRYFIINDKGRAEAAPGRHDDDVLALAIGLACDDAATEFLARRLKRDLPRDLRRAEARERDQGRWAASAECR